MLDPIDRISEVPVRPVHGAHLHRHAERASAGRDDVRVMLVAAIGCNAAWGFVDAVMYVLRSMVARGHRAHSCARCRPRRRPAAQALIADELGPMAAGLGADSVEQLRQWLLAQPPPARPPACQRARPAQRARCVPARIRFHLPGGAALRLHDRPARGDARVRRHRQRHALRLRLRLGPLCRRLAVAQLARRWWSPARSSRPWSLRWAVRRRSSSRRSAPKAISSPTTTDTMPSACSSGRHLAEDRDRQQRRGARHHRAEEGGAAGAQQCRSAAVGQHGHQPGAHPLRQHLHRQHAGAGLRQSAQVGQRQVRRREQQEGHHQHHDGDAQRVHLPAPRQRAEQCPSRSRPRRTAGRRAAWRGFRRAAGCRRP